MELKVWEEAIIIPTYGVGESEKNPMFLEKRVYQGSSGVVYPHAVIEKIEDSKHDQTYQAVFLENQYLKIMILPELGGRIQMAFDKDAFLSAMDSMTVMELNDLVKAIEEKFGVSAAAMAAPAAGGGGRAQRGAGRDIGFGAGRGGGGGPGPAAAGRADLRIERFRPGRGLAPRRHRRALRAHPFRHVNRGSCMNPNIETAIALADIVRQGGQYLVRDAGSLNGTYVNLERVDETAVLRRLPCEDADA